MGDFNVLVGRMHRSHAVFRISVRFGLAGVPDYAAKLTVPSTTTPCTSIPSSVHPISSCYARFHCITIVTYTMHVYELLGCQYTPVHAQLGPAQSAPYRGHGRTAKSWLQSASNGTFLSRIFLLKGLVLSICSLHRWWSFCVQFSPLPVGIGTHFKFTDHR